MHEFRLLGSSIPGPVPSQHHSSTRDLMNSIMSGFISRYASTQCHVRHARMVCDTPRRRPCTTDMFPQPKKKKKKKKGTLAKGALTRSMLDRILPSMLAWTTRICPALSATIETYLSQNRDSGKTCRRKTNDTSLGLFYCGPAPATRDMYWYQERRISR